MNKTLMLIGVLAVTLAGTGCATKKYVAKTMAPVQDRVTASEGKIADQGKQIATQGQEIDQFAGLEATAARFLEAAATRLGWSARSTHRVLKVARTIADLAGAPATELGHVAEALQYRSALRGATSL